MCRTTLFRLFGAFLFVLILGQLAAQSHSHSVHGEQAEFYRSLGFESEAEWDQYQRYEGAIAPRAASGCSLTHKVYGWHPYWMGSAWNNYDFSLLSTFSYFSYEVNPSTGNYNSIHGWKTSSSINAAQAAGCRVELCATLFGGTNNSTFLTNPSARQTLIDSLISLVQYRNADGINIDFEGIPGSQRNNFSTFMQSLSTQLKAAVSGATLSMALFSVDWNNVFDISALDPYVDEFIIMGYGYYYSGSGTAGPTAPLYSGSQWWSYNLTRSVLYYIGEGITQEKLLIGLPYYGNEYATVDGNVPTSSTGFQGARTFSYVKNNYLGVHTRHWDPHSLTPAWIFQSGGNWRQAWVDDAESLREKFDLVHHKNIGGIGIWALAYDNGHSDLWDLIENKFSDCRNPICADTLYDTGGPLGNYRNNEDYTFTISSPNNEKVLASFLSFDVELNWDYLYVYDGNSTADPLLGTLTGSSLPAPILSSGDALTFRFTSDGATVSPGFELAWECVGAPAYADTIYLDHRDSANLDCSLPAHVFLDSDSSAGGDYGFGEANAMTFCSPDTSKSVRLEFQTQTHPVQLELRATAIGNDYLLIWDGPDSTANPVGVFTGSTPSYPQPGTFISSGQCLTVKFISDQFSNNDGWEAQLSCTNPPQFIATQTVAQSASLNFSDSGGNSGNYGNDEDRVQTFCPDAAALSAGEGIWAEFDPLSEFQQNRDFLHIFDGPDLNSRLISSYTGNNLNQNSLFTVKATEANASGCLTFRFISDSDTALAGWNARIQTGSPRKAYGTDDCGGATLISQANVPYAGSTALALGAPNAEDPPLNISLSSQTECSGANTITRLENTVWYKFTTPATVCSSNNINFSLENISCQNSIPGGNGTQFILYEANSCQTGSAWGTPLYCADKLLDSVPVNVAGLLQPNRTYYILIDGFAGQHCNFDLILTGDISGCILPIELVEFTGKWEREAVKLQWETSFEQNNSGFWVDRGRRTASGQFRFEPIQWVDAGPASANSYTLRDPDYLRETVNFYRLRQIDLDGQEYEHKTIEIRPENLPEFSIYPNPATEILRIEVPQPEADFDLRIYDLRGREVMQSQNTALVRVAELPRGLYLYHIRNAGHSQTGRLVLGK